MSHVRSTNFQLEAASSFTSALFEIFANFILAIAFKKVIATEQKFPSVSTANGTIDALEREPVSIYFLIYSHDIYTERVYI